jgi:hypothetical protein
MQPRIRLAALALSLLLTSGVRSETTDCIQIVSAPHAIGAPGVYCLKSPVSGSIQIYSDDVVLDLNGHTLEAQAVGVHAPVLVNRVTVRNGTIRAAAYAVLLEGEGHVVEGIRAEGTIHVSGDAGTVRRDAGPGFSRSAGLFPGQPPHAQGRPAAVQ